jgi:hypothetical protein
MNLPKMPLTVPPAPAAPQAPSGLKVPSFPGAPAPTPAPIAPPAPPVQPAPKLTLPPVPVAAPKESVPGDDLNLKTIQRAQKIYQQEAKKEQRQQNRPAIKSPTESAWGKA